MYDVNYAELLLNNTTEPDPSWPTQTCVYGYEFDHSEIPYTTIATEVFLDIFKKYKFINLYSTIVNS